MFQGKPHLIPKAPEGGCDAVPKGRRRLDRSAAVKCRSCGELSHCQRPAGARHAPGGWPTCLRSGRGVTCRLDTCVWMGWTRGLLGSMSMLYPLGSTPGVSSVLILRNVVLLQHATCFLSNGAHSAGRDVGRGLFECGLAPSTDLLTCIQSVFKMGLESLRCVDTHFQSCKRNLEGQVCMPQCS